MKPLLEDFDLLMNQIQILFMKKEFEAIKSEINLHINIVFSDLKRRNSLVLYISEKKQKIYDGFSTSTGFSLIGPSETWKKILKGENSLISAFAEGNIKVPNLRVNWSKLWKFSYLLLNL